MAAKNYVKVKRWKSRYRDRFLRALLAARILRDLRRFAEKELLGVAFERADRLIDLLERLAAVNCQGLILPQSAAREAIDIRANGLDLRIERVGGLPDRFGGSRDIAERSFGFSSLQETAEAICGLFEF